MKSADTLLGRQALAATEPQQSPAPLALGNADAARILGISPSTLYALKRTGRFGPAPIRLGRCCRYRVDELRAWLAAGCPQPSQWRKIRGSRRCRAILPAGRPPLRFIIMTGTIVMAMWPIDTLTGIVNSRHTPSQMIAAAGLMVVARCFGWLPAKSAMRGLRHGLRACLRRFLR